MAAGARWEGSAAADFLQETGEVKDITKIQIIYYNNWEGFVYNGIRGIVNISQFLEGKGEEYASVYNGKVEGKT